MTAQEAAKKQTRFRVWLAAIFSLCGATAIGGMYFFDEIKGLTAALGGGGMVLSVLTGILDHMTKKTGNQVADQVADRMWDQIGSVQKTLNEMSAGFMRLSHQVSTTEHTRQQDHAQNLSKTSEIAAEVHQIKTQVDKNSGKIAAYGGAIDHIGEAVKSLKPDWNPKPH